MTHDDTVTTLDEAETELYEDSGERGDRFRSKVKRVVQAEADAAGKFIEIHSHDGIVFEQIHPR